MRRNKVKLTLPTDAEIQKAMETYKSDIKLTPNQIFVDDVFSEEIPKFSLNSVFIGDGFEISQFTENDKFYVRITSVKNGNPKVMEGRFEPHFIELQFDTYADFLTFTENIYTRSGVTQTEGLQVESVVNSRPLNVKKEKVDSKSFLKGAAATASVVGGFLIANKVIKLLNKK